MEKDAERDRDQSNHNRHSRRSFLVGASDTDAVCNRKNSVKYRRCRDASWIDGARRFFWCSKSAWKDQTCHCCLYVEACRIYSGVSAFCGDARISQRRIDRDSRHAWIGDNSKLLCYGKKYGTWRHADVRRRHADYSIQCVYINRVAVHFKKYEFGMNKNGFLIKWNFVSASLWKTWSWSHTV